MPCLLALLAIFFPRVIIILLALFSHYLGRAYDSVIWPILGFIFMPFTTLAYAFAINQRGSVTGFYAVILVVAVLMDLGALSGEGWVSRRRRI